MCRTQHPHIRKEREYGALHNVDAGAKLSESTVSGHGFEPCRSAWLDIKKHPHLSAESRYSLDERRNYEPTNHGNLSADIPAWCNA